MELINVKRVFTLFYRPAGKYYPVTVIIFVSGAGNSLEHYYCEPTYRQYVDDSQMPEMDRVACIYLGLPIQLVNMTNVKYNAFINDRIDEYIADRGEHVFLAFSGKCHGNTLNVYANHMGEHFIMQNVVENWYPNVPLTYADKIVCGMLSNSVKSMLNMRDIAINFDHNELCKFAWRWRAADFTKRLVTECTDVMLEFKTDNWNVYVESAPVTQPYHPAGALGY